MKKRIILIILASFLLINCASYPSFSRSFVTKSSDFDEIMSKSLKIHIVSDNCLLYNEYFVMDKSIKIEKIIHSNMKAYFSDYGFDVSFGSSGYFCVTTNNENIKVQYRETLKEKAIEKSPPFYLNANMEATYDFDELNGVLVNSKNILLEKDGLYFKKYNSANIEERKRLKNIKITYRDEENTNIVKLLKNTNADLGLVLFNTGMYVSFGKFIKETYAYGLMTTLLSSGMAPVLITDFKTYFNSQAIIYDLKSGKVLWSNSIENKNWDPLNSYSYKKVWFNKLFSGMPVDVLRRSVRN